jgi:hypothetical protein
MNKRKRVAWQKHRIKAKKLEERRKSLPRSMRQPASRRAAAGGQAGS